MLSLSPVMLGWQRGISLHPPSFLLLWGMALSNQAETWLVKALFALPFSLQLPRLTAWDRWKLCREGEIQEHIWVFSFSTSSPWKERNIIYKTEGDGNKEEVDLRADIPAHTAAPTLSRSCSWLLLGLLLPCSKAPLSVTQKGAF